MDESKMHVVENELSDWPRSMLGLIVSDEQSRRP